MSVAARTITDPSRTPANSPEETFAARVPYQRRKKLGQFFTPPAVARAMVRWTCARQPAGFLDPAVGPGIFIEQLARTEISAETRIVGTDIDPDVLPLARARVPVGRFESLDLRTADFLEAPLPDTFDAVVCNPPYIRHHDAKLPERVFRRFEADFHMRLSRLTNVYCLFLLRITKLLSATGRAAVITPTEFLNADFGRAVKRALLACPAFRGFIVFDYAANVFDGILSTATITLFDAAESSETITFSKVADANAVDVAFDPFGGQDTPASPNCAVQRIARSDLDPSAKWSTSGNGIVNPSPGDLLRPLSAFASCTRGIATGANAFFTMTREEAATWSIPDDLLRPCITKAAQARRPNFAPADYEALAASGKKCLILDATRRDAPRIQKYLDHGIARQIHRRYLTRTRRLWYLTEQRRPADLLVTVFGRKRLRFVRNAARVLNLTAFHAVYMKPAYKKFVAYLLCYFHSAAAARASAQEHRVYGDGLLKFEPKDVERLYVPDLDAVDKAAFEAAVDASEALAAQTSHELDARLQARIDALFAKHDAALAQPADPQPQSNGEPSREERQLSEPPAQHMLF
ncbi:MAG: N-6 DNA methylase [Planctomycetota bacterium]|nr:N-6 DNA methylase [Planctomycetota bacterium]